MPKKLVSGQPSPCRCWDDLGRLGREARSHVPQLCQPTSALRARNGNAFHQGCARKLSKLFSEGHGHPSGPIWRMALHGCGATLTLPKPRRDQRDPAINRGMRRWTQSLTVANDPYFSRRAMRPDRIRHFGAPIAVMPSQLRGTRWISRTNRIHKSSDGTLTR